MHKLLVAAALIAIVPAGAIKAQQTRVTTTVTTQTPVTVNPEAAEAAANAEAAVQPAPSAQDSLGADGVIRQWNSQAPVAQAVPPPARDYPPCTRGRTDSCYNPDPSKEADVRKDGKIGA